MATDDEGHKVALITGITGQDGSYLAELLLAKGYYVSRSGVPPEEACAFLEIQNDPTKNMIVSHPLLFLCHRFAHLLLFLRSMGLYVVPLASTQDVLTTFTVIAMRQE